MIAITQHTALMVIPSIAPIMITPSRIVAAISAFSSLIFALPLLSDFTATICVMLSPYPFHLLCIIPKRGEQCKRVSDISDFQIDVMG